MSEAPATLDHLTELDLESLPPPRMLTIQLVGLAALQIATFLKFNPVDVRKVGDKLFLAKTNFYGLVIEGTTADAVNRKAVCRKFWARQVEKKSNLDRLDWEAELKLVGGPLRYGKPIYCSDTTLNRYREKAEITMAALEKIKLLNMKTSEVFSMAELAKDSASRRLSELYFIAKNLELMAKDRSMPWLFVTFTAPPEYHPNPSHLNSKNTYRADLGVKSSHDYIRTAWARIRSYLNKNGVLAGPEGYFGFRTAETHKDSSIHWHLQVFIKEEFLQLFKFACRREFPLKNQVKFVLGDDDKGNAASYIFKYLVKDVNSEELPSDVNSAVFDSDVDERRERDDLASIRNSFRVKAALRSMNIRQYQLFGVNGVLTLLRELNKIDFDALPGPVEGMLGAIKHDIWRSPNGLKNLFSLMEASTDSSGPRIHIVKENAESTYGEARKRVIGVAVDGQTFRSNGRYQVLPSR